MTHPYFTVVGKCQHCGRPLVHGETRQYLHRLEDFDPAKRIDCWTPEPEEQPMMNRIEHLDILHEVGDERARQDQKWGEQNHPNGTGPGEVFWAGLMSKAKTYGALATRSKQSTDDNAKCGVVTFADILLEEVFEAMAEEDPAKLRVELIQVAAVATQWVQKIDRDTASR